MQFYFSNVEHPRFSSFLALFFHLFSKNIFFCASCQDDLRHHLFLHFYQDTLLRGYFPFYDCPSLRPICPRSAWGQDHWIDRDKRCVLKVRQDIWSLSYFKIHYVILVNFRSDATSKTVPKCIRSPYGCARSDRRTEELPSISQVV